MKLKSLMLIFIFLLDRWVNADPNLIFEFNSSANRVIEKLETDGVINGLHRHTRPYNRSHVAQIVDVAQQRIKSEELAPTSIHLQLLQKLERQLQLNPDDSNLTEKFHMRGLASLRSYAEIPKIAPSYQQALLYQFGQKIIIYQELEIDNLFNRTEHATKYPAQGSTAEKRINQWQGNYTADFKRVYLDIPVAEGTSLTVGRDQIFWGTGRRHSVGISDNSPPFDLILISSNFSSVRGTAFISKLDRMWHQDTRRYLADRYLSGHRLDWRLSDRIELGISEIVLYGGDARGLEWYYLNPILPYYASQFNADTQKEGLTRNDNVMLLFEGAVRPIKGLRIYGELFVDDFSYIGHGDPNDLAFLTGIIWNNLLKSQRLSLVSEYVRVNRWTYTHLVEENQYTHFGSIIGHRIGNDADQLYLEANYWLNADTRLALFCQFNRNGEANVDHRFRGEKYSEVTFPSGTVEGKHQIGCDLSSYQANGWQFDLRFSHLIILNKDHKIRPVEHHNQLAFQIGYQYDWDTSRTAVLP
ncbi:TPA: hypothetical protein EYM26_10855 [Candidatus Poribacteria bacterium]|nr:hypothetical protein [Candidatus Poribacteria bacterium]